jgi:hypothetical protein
MATNKHRGTCLISMGGKKRGVIFNMNTYAIFCEGMDIEITQIEEVFNGRKQQKAFCWLMYSGCVAYDEKHGNNLDYDIHDFYDWVLDMSDKDSELVTKTMLASRQLKNDSNNGVSRNVIEATDKEVLKKN